MIRKIEIFGPKLARSGRFERSLLTILVLKKVVFWTFSKLCGNLEPKARHTRLLLKLTLEIFYIPGHVNLANTVKLFTIAVRNRLYRKVLREYLTNNICVEISDGHTTILL